MDPLTIVMFIGFWGTSIGWYLEHRGRRNDQDLFYREIRRLQDK